MALGEGGLDVADGPVPVRMGSPNAYADEGVVRFGAGALRVPVNGAEGGALERGRLSRRKRTKALTPA